MNKLFEKIYCINLDHRTDRWERASNFFKQNDINVERFSAIKHSHGATGCAISHLTIIKNAKELNLKNVFIFEDDFQFDNYDLNYIEKAFSELPNDWDIFYLGYNPLEKLISYSDELYKINSSWCLHAYAINNTFYDEFINIAGIPIDVPLRNIQRYKKIFGVKENLCLQINNYSDIDNIYATNRDHILNNFNKYR